MSAAVICEVQLLAAAIRDDVLDTKNVFALQRVIFFYFNMKTVNKLKKLY